MSTLNFQNKGVEFRYLFFALILIIACQKKEKTDSSRSMDRVESNFKTTLPSASKKKSPPYPDKNTFFPLIPGSYWVYNDIIDGEVIAGSKEKDSLTSIKLTDTGYIAEMVVQIERDTSIRIVRYRVDLDGMVWIENSINTGYKPFTVLNPVHDQKIGIFTFHKGNENSFTLENFAPDSDTLKEEQKESWNAKYFERGIGLESQALIYSSVDLVEYRIGLEGDVVLLKK